MFTPIQKKVKDFASTHDLTSGMEYKILMAQHELGEIAKEALKMSSGGKRPMDTQPTAKMLVELGELLYCVADMANAMNVDLNEALDLALDKFKAKLVAKDQ